MPGLRKLMLRRQGTGLQAPGQGRRQKRDMHRGTGTVADGARILQKDFQDVMPQRPMYADSVAELSRVCTLSAWVWMCPARDWTLQRSEAKCGRPVPDI